MTDVTTENLLIGADFGAVCARYGAPLHCTHEHGVLRLAYEGEDGAAVDGAVELVDGVVATLAPAIRRSRRVRSERERADQEMVGWPVEIVLPALGRPVRSVALGESRRIEFAQCVVTVHEGTVACVESAPEPAPASLSSRASA